LQLYTSVFKFDLDLSVTRNYCKVAQILPITRLWSRTAFMCASSHNSLHCTDDQNHRNATSDARGEYQWTTAHSQV